MPSDWSFSQSSQEQPTFTDRRPAAPHEGSLPENVTAQQPPDASPRSSTPDAPSPSATKYTQVHHDAAQRIQQLYRQQRSLRITNDIASQFEGARNSFSLPEVIDFIDPTSASSVDGNVVTVDTALPISEASAGAPSKFDDDWDVVTKTSNDQITEDGSPDSMPQSSKVVTPSEGGQIDIRIPDEEPWVALDPEQSETSSSSVTDSEVDEDANDEESLNSTPAAEAGKTVVGADIAVGDLDVKDNTARLAYTKQNYPIHVYMEKLNVLLVKLDGVESHGSKEVRDRRKQVARSIEMEAERIEKLVQDIWRTYTSA